MAEIVLPPGYGEAKFIWTLSGKANPITSTIGVAIPGVTVEAWADAAEFMFGDISTGALAPCHADNMGNIWTFQGVEITFNLADVIYRVGSTHAPIVGTLSGLQPPPINCSLLAQKRTALVGRKYRGRMYLPCLYLEESVVDVMGNISELAYEIEASHWNTWFTAMIGSIEYEVYVLHSGPTVPTLIGSMSLEKQLATQRRRMR